MSEHVWTDPMDGVSYIVTERNATGRSTQAALCREILILVGLDREREIFVAELIGALGLDREAIDRGPKMVGDVVLQEVRRVADEPARIRRELLAWADEFMRRGAYLDSFLEALDRICPEAE